MTFKQEKLVGIEKYPIKILNLGNLTALSLEVGYKADFPLHLENLE